MLCGQLNLHAAIWKGGVTVTMLNTTQLKSSGQAAFSLTSENEHRAIWSPSSVFECVTGLPWILMGVLKQTGHMSLCPSDVCPQDKFCCVHVSGATEKHSHTVAH